MVYDDCFRRLQGLANWQSDKELLENLEQIRMFPEFLNEGADKEIRDIAEGKYD